MNAWALRALVGQMHEALDEAREVAEEWRDRYMGDYPVRPSQEFPWERSDDQ